MRKQLPFLTQAENNSWISGFSDSFKMQEGILYYYDCSQWITNKETNTNLVHCLVVKELWIFYLAQKVKVWRGSKTVMHFSGHLLRGASSDASFSQFKSK